MDVILLERVAKLGQMGDVVSVKEGYARNYLLPQRKALRANQNNIDAFEAQKAQLEARNLETKKEAEDLAGRLRGQQFIVIRSASDSGALYGSVTTRDAADAATESGFSLDRKQVALTRPIKELGLHTLLVNLHPEVEVEIELNVARSVGGSRASSLRQVDPGTGCRSGSRRRVRDRRTVRRYRLCRPG